MPVRYTNNQGIQTALVPAPLITLNKVFIKGPTGFTDHVQYNITMTGTLLNIGTSLDSPSVTTDAGFSQAGVMGQQAYVENVIFGDGGRLEITDPNGGPNPIDMYCFVESISFNPSVWVNICTYNVTLRSRKMEGTADPDNMLDSYNEGWQVNELEDQSYTITHTLSAKAALAYDGGVINDPLSIASGWVYSRMFTTSTSGILLGNSNAINQSGINFNLADLVVQLPSTTNNFWNFVHTETIDPQNYTVNATESFVYNPFGNTKELWNASVQYEQNNLFRAVVNLTGEVIGYSDLLSDLNQRNLNASGQFFYNIEPNLYLRALNYAPSGFTASPLPTTKQVSFERPHGTLRYSYGFHVYNGSLIPNAIEENITINDIAPTDVFAQIPVPGRANGPVVQYMFTNTLPERSVSISATLVPNSSPVSSGSLLAAYLAKPNTDALIGILQPSAGNFYVRQDHEEWNPLRRLYGRSVNWTLQPNGSGVAGLPNAPRNPALI